MLYDVRSLWVVCKGADVRNVDEELGCRQCTHECWVVCLVYGLRSDDGDVPGCASPRWSVYAHTCAGTCSLINETRLQLPKHDDLDGRELGAFGCRASNRKHATYVPAQMVAEMLSHAHESGRRNNTRDYIPHLRSPDAGAGSGVRSSALDESLSGGLDQPQVARYRAVEQSSATCAGIRLKERTAAKGRRSSRRQQREF